MKELEDKQKFIILLVICCY